jgi:transcription antitermination factor NusG
MRVGDLVRYRGGYYADWLGVITEATPETAKYKVVHWINLRDGSVNATSCKASELEDLSANR